MFPIYMDVIWTQFKLGVTAHFTRLDRQQAGISTLPGTPFILRQNGMSVNIGEYFE